MTLHFTRTQIISGLLMLFFLTSCNTYQWQRKRYYKAAKSKNWNNYNPKKSKEDDENEEKRYYKKD